MNELALLAGLLALVVATAVGTVQARNLYAATILLGIYSLLMALTWTLLHAVDVAFTEASVGAGVSTILLFAALVRIGGRETENQSNLHLPALLLVLLLGGLLAYGLEDAPAFGDPDAPVHRRAAAFYTSLESYHLSHSKNLATPVLASYRGYDTLFETAVIFTAGLAMILLLRKESAGSPAEAEEIAEDPPAAEPDAVDPGRSARLLGRPGGAPRDLGRHPVLSKVCKTVVPFVVVFGLYVITHGELGPGGGFQGGVIIAAAFVLVALVFGLPRARQFLPRAWSDALAGVGVLVYAGVGLTTMALGGTYLEYARLALDPEHPAGGQTLGMTLVEMGVGVTVAAVMATIFSEMVED